MTEAFRKPAIFSVDDPRLVAVEPDAAPPPDVEAMVEAPADNLPAVSGAAASGGCGGGRCSGRHCPAWC